MADLQEAVRGCCWWGRITGHQVTKPPPLSLTKEALKVFQNLDEGHYKNYDDLIHRQMSWCLCLHLGVWSGKTSVTRICTSAPNKNLYTQVREPLW